MADIEALKDVIAGKEAARDVLSRELAALRLSLRELTGEPARRGRVSRVLERGSVSDRVLHVLSYAAAPLETRDVANAVFGRETTYVERGMVRASCTRLQRKGRITRRSRLWFIVRPGGEG